MIIIFVNDVTITTSDEQSGNNRVVIQVGAAITTEISINPVHRFVSYVLLLLIMSENINIRNV